MVCLLSALLESSCPTTLARFLHRRFIRQKVMPQVVEVFHFLRKEQTLRKIGGRDQEEESVPSLRHFLCVRNRVIAHWRLTHC